jgi:flagellar basal-body rod protein FlgF
MVRGLYASATAMVAEITRQEVIANNLANASSPGFQRQLVAFATLPPAGGPDAGAVALEPGTRVTTLAADPTPGSLHESGDPLEVALDGPGFFVVQTASGLVYTRDGGFRVGPTGRLETRSGDAVLGQAGPIVPGKRAVTIGEDGTLFADGQPLDRLQVVQEGPTGIEPVAQPRLRPGSREGSNVNPVREMAAMIAGFRVYEANQRALQMQDRTLEVATSEVARL